MHFRNVKSLRTEEAFRWFQILADQDDADGQYYVGWMYFNGYGVKKNLKKAKEYIELAAEQGHSTAIEFFEENFD